VKAFATDNGKYIMNARWMRVVLGLLGMTSGSPAEGIQRPATIKVEDSTKNHDRNKSPLGLRTKKCTNRNVKYRHSEEKQEEEKKTFRYVEDKIRIFSGPSKRASTCSTSIDSLRQLVKGMSRWSARVARAVCQSG